MSPLASWIIDKSAYVRLPESPDAELWSTRIERGFVTVATVTLLEIGYSARSGPNWRRVMDTPPVSRFVVDALTPAIEQRALDVQGKLAHAGQHRAPAVSDLLVAALGERMRRTVLHVDKDFELIAEVTGQPVERLRLG